MKRLSDIDLNKNQLKNARLDNSSADPSAPGVGQTYFNTTTKHVKIYNGATWDSLNTKGNLTSVLVASSTSSATDKALADYICDGTSDNVEIQAAIDSVKTAGGSVLLSNGTFNISASLILEGDDSSDSVNINLRGQGNETTVLNGANDIDVITLRKVVKVNISDIQIKVLGTGNGIKSVAKTTSPYRSFWNSSFKNIYVRGDFSTHTGWAFYLEAPFRSTFENIEGNGIGNGMYLSATDANFNPGNCTFTRCFFDLSQVNGKGFYLYTPDTGGQFNISKFQQCEAIDSASGSTTSIGFYLRGSSTAYFATKNIYVDSSNIENFNTAIKIEHSVSNTLFFNYVETKHNGTYLDVNSNSTNNHVDMLSTYIPSGRTVKIINDLNTSSSQPTVVRRLEGYVEGTANATLSATTKLFYFGLSGPGTIASSLVT